tara:strand:- start:136 stop:528 length:393 start_codon:yes stop_codon:yes gene_type:complete
LKPEVKLYRDLKKNIPSISWNRLENRSLSGTPDLLGYNNSGTFFTVELKYTLAYRIRFSPHQIAFHVKHPKNTFILVACARDKLVRLYPGSQILDLVESGLKLESLKTGWPACRLLLESLGAYRRDSLFP